MTLKQAYQDVRYLYILIVNENKIEYKDEYLCAYMMADKRKQILPKKYVELYKKLSYI